MNCKNEYIYEQKVQGAKGTGLITFSYSAYKQTLIENNICST